MAVSVIFGNYIIAAAILNILKSVIILNNCMDIDYAQIKFQVNPCIIHRVVFMADSVNFGNDFKVAAILNIK